MIMNMKLTATLAALVAAGAMSTFGQGYVLFVTAKSGVYDNFSGASVVAPGDVTGTFLWNASTTAADPLGAGVATTATTLSGSWGTVSNMMASGWNVASNGGTEADVADNASGSFKGQQAYNGGVSCGLQNSAAGSSIEVVVIGWDNLTGAGTLGAAAQAGDALGWSGAFVYATGGSAGATVSTFGQSGFAPFGVVGATPEPTSLAIAGLGGLSMLFLRRRKS